MHAFIVGIGSEIAGHLSSRLMDDGWHVEGSFRGTSLPAGQWDLAIFAQGTMEPIGRFFETDLDEWTKAIHVNALQPLSVLRMLWPSRNKGAKVVFLGGPNLAKTNPTYTAYRAGKAMLESILPTLNEEYPHNKFLMLHPGVVNTKFHQQSIAAGDRAANHAWVKRIVSGEQKSVSHDEVYAKLKELIA